MVVIIYEGIKPFISRLCYVCDANDAVTLLQIDRHTDSIVVKPNLNKKRIILLKLSYTASTRLVVRQYLKTTITTLKIQ